MNKLGVTGFVVDVGVMLLFYYVGAGFWNLLIPVYGVWCYYHGVKSK